MLVRCPKCGKEISDMANKCPNCGYCLREKVDFSFSKKKCVYFIGFAAVIIIIIFALLYKYTPERNVSEEIRNISESSIIAMDLYLEGKITKDEFEDKIDLLNNSMTIYEEKNKLNGKEQSISYSLSLVSLSPLDGEIRETRDEINDFIN